MDLVAPLWGRGGAACMSFRHSAGAYLELMPRWLLMNPEGPLEEGVGGSRPCGFSAGPTGQA